jgi:hydrogenase-4 component B
MQQFRVTSLGGRLTLALAGAAVALTAGFAGVTFVRLVGMIVLGPVAAARSSEFGWAGRIGIAVLALCPLAIAAVTPLEIRVIAAGLSQVVPSGLTMGALKSPWVLQPVYSGFSILSPSWLWIELPLMFGLVALLALGMSRGRILRVRRVPAWKSATIGVDGADSYTAFGYANPTRRVLASVLHTRAEVVADGDSVPHLRYDSDVVEVVESWLYRPAARLFAGLVTVAKRLQSGRLDAYLLYMLIALVAVVAVVTALA